MGGPGSGRGGKHNVPSDPKGKTSITQHLRSQTTGESALVNNKSTSPRLPPARPAGTLDASAANAILEKLQDLTNEIIELRKESADTKAAIYDLQALRQDINAVSTKMTMLSAENQLLRERLTDLEQKEDRRDRKERNKNFFIKGLQMDELTTTSLHGWLAETLEVTAQIKEVTPIRKLRGSAVVRMATLAGKDAVMSNKSKLRGSSISINHDRTIKDRQVQAKIYAIAKREESEGHKVKMGFKRLDIDGVPHVWIDGKGLTKQTRPPSSSPSQRRGLVRSQLGGAASGGSQRNSDPQHSFRFDLEAGGS